MARRSKEKEIEEFILERLKKWLKIQKENEKNLWYIG